MQNVIGLVTTMLIVIQIHAVGTVEMKTMNQRIVKLIIERIKISIIVLIVLMQLRKEVATLVTGIDAQHISSSKRKL